ncbi:MAG: hypothetical protein KGM42_11520 [Hyphomicrobiales bacterium]|nr:hypothetical protein [Hyphomicrobiales bacterium]
MDETLEFISDMRTRLFRNAPNFKAAARTLARKHLLQDYFDFKDMSFVSPTSALVLAAIYDRLNSITGFKPYTVDEDRWHKDVYDVLCSIGFHDLLKMKPHKLEIKNISEIIIQKFISGEQVDNVLLGRLHENIVKSLDKEAQERILYAEPYGGMIEAALNSFNWAYPQSHSWDYPAVPRWWMTGAIDRTNRIVTVAVFDQGVSIPVRLPSSKYWSGIEGIVARFLRRNPNEGDAGINDATALRIAMQLARSATGLPQHGKGLHTMIEVAERAKIGQLRILSRFGHYIWRTGERPLSSQLKFPLDGTLVEWKLQL